jgi:hypothetical protein
MTKVRTGPNCVSIGLARDALTGVMHNSTFSSLADTADSYRVAEPDRRSARLSTRTAFAHGLSMKWQWQALPRVSARSGRPSIVAGGRRYLCASRPEIASENVYRIPRCLTPCQPVSPVRSSARRTGSRLVTYLVTCPVMPRALSQLGKGLELRELVAGAGFEPATWVMSQTTVVHAGPGSPCSPATILHGEPRCLPSSRTAPPVHGVSATHAATWVMKRVSPAASEHEQAYYGKPPMPSWRWVRRVRDRRFVPTVTDLRSCDTQDPPFCSHRVENAGDLRADHNWMI